MTIIEGDALKIDERDVAGEGAHVVANLPYNVGTALLLKWLGDDWPPWWRSLTLMFQKEVAERLVAGAWKRCLWPAVDRGPMAVAAPDRDDGQPLRLRPAAQGYLGSGAYRARRAARGRRSEEHGTAHRSGVRPAAEDASIEPEGHAGALDAAEGSASTRSGAPKRSASGNG